MSRLGLGLASIGGMYAAVPQDQAVATIDRIDILHIHDPELDFPAASTGALRALADTANGVPPGYARVPPAVLERIHRLRELAKEYDVPLLAAALQFPLQHPAVPAVAVGARSPREITDAVAWLDQKIPAAFWAALRSAV